MVHPARIKKRKFRAYGRGDLPRIPELKRLGPDALLEMQAVSAVLPFRTNAYVVEELIRWDRVPDDPIYQLTFPQPGMLDEKDFRHMLRLVSNEAPADVVHEAARTGGLGGEIAARVTEECFYSLEAPVLRVTGFDTPYPPARVEEEYLPDLDRILDAVDRSLEW